MTRVLLVLALVTTFAGCASSAPAPAPSASVSATVIPRYTPRAYCFETRGVWRPTADVCEYEEP